MRLDYLTIGYWGDIRLLHLQARSMAKYLDPDSVQTLIVVNNDPTPDRFAAYFGSDILPEYRHLAGRVRLVPSEDLLAPTPNTKGYWRQQALKLLGYRITEGESYITLDAKNLLIRPIDWTYFFDEAGRNIGRHRLLKDHLQGPLRYFGVAVADMPEAVLDIYTPFGLRRSVCRDLDEHLRGSTGLNIGQFLCSQQTLEERPLYEYLMYSAYLHAHGGGIERFHQLSRTSLSLTYLCNDPKVGPESMLGGTKAERYRMVGVHRRVAKADAGTKASFAELFLTFGLVGSLVEGLHFLEPTA